MKKFIVFLVGIAFTTLQAEYKIQTGVFGTGGGVTSGTTQKIIGTLGQPGIGIAVEPAYKASLGFWYTRTGFVTGIAEEQTLPLKFQLEQNYPNPFNPSTTIAFEIPKPGPVHLEIYNVRGERIRMLISGEQYHPGRWEIRWDGIDEKGHMVPSGMYVVRFVAGDFIHTRKMLLMK